MSRTVRTRVLLYLLPLLVCSFHGASPYALTDDCLKLDINELEDYISELNFENVPTINMMTGGFECPVTALPFGALKSDWTRLLLLQQAQTEGSILKEKLNRVYKVLIYAYYRMEERFDSKRVGSTFADSKATTMKEDLENGDKKYNVSSATSSLFPLAHQTIYPTSNGVDKKEEKTTKVSVNSAGTSELPNQNLDKDTSTETSYNNLDNNTRISSSPLYEYTISTGGEIPKVNDVISQTSILNEWTESDTTDWKQKTESNKELFSTKVVLYNLNKSVEGNEVDSNFTITTTESIFQVTSNGDKGSRLISTESYYNTASPPVQSDAEGTSTTAESSESSSVITYLSASDSSVFPTSGDQQIVTMNNFESTTPLYSSEQTAEPKIEIKNLTEIAEETSSKSSDTFERLISDNDIGTTMQIFEIDKNSTISSVSLKPTQANSLATADVKSATEESRVTSPKKVEKANGMPGTFERLTSNNDVETTMQIADVQEDSTIPSTSLEPDRMTSSAITGTETTTDENRVNPVKPIDNRVVSCIQNFHREDSGHRTNNVYQTFKHDSIPRNSTDGSFYRNVTKDRTLFNKPPTRNDLWKYIVITQSVSSTASPISKPVSNQTEETKQFTKDPSTFRKRGSLNTSVEKTFQWFYSVHRGNTEQRGNDPVDRRGTNIECNGGK